MEKLGWLNNLAPEQARQEFLRCCGSSTWAMQMALERPFTDMDTLLKAAVKIWNRLTPKDWLEAFKHHPKIGDKASLKKKFASTARWASGEQKGVEAATEDILEGLTEGNRAYESKFGFIFIVCATGKSAAEMLSLLQKRLGNTPAEELAVAAAEQAKITRIRLEKLLKSSSE